MNLKVIWEMSVQPMPSSRPPVTRVNKRLPSLNALRVFEVAARRRSFKDAADEICVSQSAVSRHIHTLERQLGVSLFYRLYRAVELTDAGEMLYATVSGAFTEIYETTRVISQHDTPATSKVPLVISAPPGLAELWLGSRLGNFCRANPDIEPEIMISRNIQLLLTGIVDVAVHWGRAEWQNPAHDVLTSLTEFPVCSPRLFETGPPLRSLRDLSHHRLLHWESRGLWGAWLKEFNVEDIEWNAGPLLHDYSLYLDMAVASEGMALVDEVMVAEYLFSGQLIKPFPEVRISPNELHLLVSPHTEKLDAACAFKDWIVLEMELHRQVTEEIREPKSFGLRPKR